MKTIVYNGDGSKGNSLDLPVQFNEEVRPDLIKRAVLSLQSKSRQPYGNDPRAGKEHSTKLSRRRHHYKTAYGRGISRVPRKTMLRRGTQFIWVGARAAGTVGGARAHPPKVEKIWAKKINDKERLKAIRSAISATVDKNFVINHGYRFTDSLPVVLNKESEKINKTKTIKDLLEKIGLRDDLKRAETTRVRAGRGKIRGRRVKTVKGPLIVVSKDCKLMTASKNIIGVEVCKINSLNAGYLAPGAVPGRLVIWTEDAIKTMEKEKLFLNKRNEK